MIICRNCNIPMQPVMSFSKDKHEKFNECSKCHDETRHRRLNDDELTFGEIFNKELHK